MAEVQGWLGGIGLVRHKDTFLKNGFDDLETISTIDPADLATMGILGTDVSVLLDAVDLLRAKLAQRTPVASGLSSTARLAVNTGGQPSAGLEATYRAAKAADASLKSGEERGAGVNRSKQAALTEYLLTGEEVVVDYAARPQGKTPTAAAAIVVQAKGKGKGQGQGAAAAATAAAATATATAGALGATASASGPAVQLAPKAAAQVATMQRPTAPQTLRKAAQVPVHAGEDRPPMEYLSNKASLPPTANPNQTVGPATTYVGRAPRKGTDIKYAALDGTQSATSNIASASNTVLPTHRIGGLGKPAPLSHLSTEGPPHLRAPPPAAPAKPAPAPRKKYPKKKPAPVPTTALGRVKAKIIARGGMNGIRSLGRTFKIMDDSGNKSLSRTEFKWGLKDYGLFINDADLDEVMRICDRNKDGAVDFDEFMRALRGDLNEERLKYIHMAFDILDKTGDGIVTVDDIKGTYDVSGQPDVIDGSQTPEDALKEFMAQWEKGSTEVDGIITRSEFEDYYRDVSASIDDDEYFRLVIVNAWHINEEGNTSNLRVLVTYNDGTQEVVGLHNDLGVKPDDTQEIIKRLNAQGVTNIKKISRN